MKAWQWDLMLSTLASPILLVRATIRGGRRLATLRKATQTSVFCRTCGSTVSLVGLWRCPCGFTYQGNLVRYCPICGAFPRMIRCYRCGTTETIAV